MKTILSDVDERKNYIFVILPVGQGSNVWRYPRYSLKAYAINK